MWGRVLGSRMCAVPRYGRTVAEDERAGGVGGPAAEETPGAQEPTRLDRAATVAFGTLASYGYVSVPCRWPGCTAYSNGSWRVEIDHDWKEGELLVRIGAHARDGGAAQPLMRPVDQLLSPATLKRLRLRRLSPSPSVGILSARLSDLLVALRSELSGFPG
jgi:hypothetical protein